MARSSCSHMRSSGGQGRQHSLLPTMGSLAALGALAVGLLSLGCLLSLQLCTLQWGLMMGIRLVTFSCTAGIAIPERVHSDESQMGDSSPVFFTHEATEA